MIRYGSGTVDCCLARRGAVQELLVRMDDGSLCKALLYTDTLPPAASGDRLLLNVTAETLRLGSGGYHYVVQVEGKQLAGDSQPQSERADAATAAAGHIMKLRYTPLQRSVLAVEEAASPHHGLFVEEQSLGGMPVLIGELHSMLPVAAVWLGERALTGRRDAPPPPRVAYVMSDGGALPLAYSVHAHTLRERGYIAASVAYGHAYGGDSEAVNKFTALLAAKHVHHAQIAIACMGPGIVGTGTALGHSGMELSELIHAVHLLGGTPVVMPRISFADSRARHRGVSHHLLTQLARYTLAPAHVPLPADQLAADELQWLDSQMAAHRIGDKHAVQRIARVGADDVARCLANYPRAVRTMGRGQADDPAFFVSVACAAEHAYRLYAPEHDNKEDSR